jgi:hypothetical protein
MRTLSGHPIPASSGAGQEKPRRCIRAPPGLLERIKDLGNRGVGVACGSSVTAAADLQKCARRKTGGPTVAPAKKSPGSQGTGIGGGVGALTGRVWWADVAEMRAGRS